jgi:tRNA A-37 threonylcarbamoyl transferase component Bud32
MTASAIVNFAPDAALPQRDLLLDVDEVTRRFAAQLGAGGAIKITRCEQIRVKYSPGTSLRVLHRIQIEDASYTVAARAFTAGRSKSVFEEAAKDAFPCGPLLPVAHDAELEAVYWTFPNDRRMTNLSVLASPPESLAVIDGQRWTQSRVVAYAPEKCLTAQCLNERHELLAYAKIYAEGEQGGQAIYKALAKLHLTAEFNLLIPRLIAYSQEQRILLLEPIAGSRLADLSGAARVEGFRRLGATLALLHSLPTPVELLPFERLDVDLLEEAAQIIGQTRPDVAELAERLARELYGSRGSATGAPVFLHGDVHPKNGILQNGRVAMIDLDQAGTGPAAADLGSLLAALRYCRRIGQLSLDEEKSLASAFLSGYCQNRQLPEAESLRWHTAAALLAERALRAVGRVRREGLACMQELLLDAWGTLTEESYG